MTSSTGGAERAVRDLADDHVHRLAALDPIVAGLLGWAEGQDRLPDLSPDGVAAREAVDRTTLDRLAGLEVSADPDERRCARLLAERLHADLEHSRSGEPLRAVQEHFGSPSMIRMAFTLMPVDSEESWARIATRFTAVPDALDGYRRSLAEGRRRGLLAAPRQVDRVVEQLGSWIADDGGRGWFSALARDAAVGDAPVGRTLRADLDRGAAVATGALAGLRDWLATEYLPATDGTPDGVGEERYRTAVRFWSGAAIDTDEVYSWGWSEYQRLREEMVTEAGRVLPGATTRQAMDFLDSGGGAAGTVEGGEAARARLQQVMDEVIATLDGTHFDLSGPLGQVEARLAPVGSAASPYYTPPSLDFSRTGRTWLPASPDDRYRMWNLLSVWYHEGVPGHHLQLTAWAMRATELSLFQTSLVGAVSADVEGWALYAERLMDELGYHTDPATRLGFLNLQMMRAVRVVVDIGMHLGLRIPGDSPIEPGQRWTPERGHAFFAAHVGGFGTDHAGSELLRYLGAPGQAIGYKLGERAWLAGRERARTAQGERFDLATWHAAALAQGTLGLDDLVDELAELPPPATSGDRR